MTGPRARIAAILVAAALGSCQRTTALGSAIECQRDAECAPPATVCGADNRCTPGCASDPDACVGGSVCDPSTGACAGGVVIGQPCARDVDCDPPALVCNPSKRQCAAGCNVDPGQCAAGRVCDMTSGHCCDPADPACAPTVDMKGGCSTDGDCAAQPGSVCVAGACVAGCGASGCPTSQTCASDGHCHPTTGQCARDADCDSASYCATSTGACTLLSDGGPTKCQGGAIDRDGCNRHTSAAEWKACVGPAGPPACPYCVDGSCYLAGYCATDADCHRGETCAGNLCVPQSPACPPGAMAVGSDVVAGHFAAGHELCVRDVVSDTYAQYDGDFELVLGKARLAAILTPQYAGAGLARPAVGATVTVHGAVRWDEWHARWELHPIDWWQ